MIISFSGLDGSGKTTLVKKTGEYLLKQGLKVKELHIVKNSFSYFVLHKMIGKISKKLQRNLENNLRRNDKKRLWGVVKKTLLFIYLLYFDLRYGWYKGNKKYYLVCDRYFYDELIQLKYLGIHSSFFARLYTRFILKPDLGICLNISSHTAQYRKPEFEKEYFEWKEREYKKLKFLYNITTNSEMVFEKVVKRKLDQILGIS